MAVFNIISRFEPAKFGNYAINFLLLAGVFIVCWKLINKISKIIDNFLNNAKVERSVITFLNSISKFSLRILLIITAIVCLGIEITPILAALGASLVTIGLALKDNVANIFSGILIIINRPFKVGDYIEFENLKGKVIKIEMMFTTVETVENKIAVIPNNKLAMNSIIKNK
jgi:small conductance mechanosensitive channel